MIGTLIGQYRVVSAIGSGGMGHVYLGEHTLIGRRAAIKLLRPELSARRDVVERFFNEARAAAAVNHPGIVQILDFGFEDHGGAYLVMEFLDGRSLGATLRASGALPPGDALRVIRQVAGSIASVHAAGIVHRDLKPDNIFLLQDPEVAGGLRAKVLDFGIAKLGDAFNVETTAVGGFMGTPLYMAPEQFDGIADPRSDIYALGCVLFEALVGSAPFHGDSVTQLFSAHTQRPAPAPSSCAAVAPAIDGVVLRCLEKRPADRFASMTELADAIGELLAHPHDEAAAIDDRGPTRLPPRTPGSSAPPITRQPPEWPATDHTPTLGMVPTAVTPAGLATADAGDASYPRGGPPIGYGAPPPLIARSGPARDARPLAPFRVMLDLAARATRRLRPTTKQHAMQPAPRTAAGTSSPLKTVMKGAPPPPAATMIALPDLAEPAAPTLAEVFAEAAPPGFRGSLAFVVEFFQQLFATARPLQDRVVELGSPSIRDLEARAHYVVFVDEIDGYPRAPMGELNTVAFRAHVDPLARRLEALDTPPGSVLITILSAPHLGQGARETIFALRKERNLFVVPLAASEIRRACEAGNARLLLINRIADLHTVSDPFAVYEDFTDPTRCIGFAAEVADLIKHITAGGNIISVAGPPGSGKTSVVVMAEYGCDTNHVSRQFVRLHSNELTSHDPAELVQALHERVGRLGQPSPIPAADLAEPADMHATIMQLDSAPDHRARRDTGLGHRHQLVIVLEDADWLIRLASSAEPDAEQRERARELWRGLAHLCSSGGHTVIVTSVRDFQVMDQVPLEHPVPVSRVPMRALNRRESDRLVSALGELVGFHPTRRALARLHRESGGNVHALRLLCSDVIRATREHPDYSPLARLTVTTGRVDQAVDHIAATGTTFRPHVSVWLDDIERTVLQHVARARPRSSRSLRRALQGSAEPDRIVHALDGLELMGLIESKRGRLRVRVPLFERWINAHLDTPAPVDTALRQARLSRLALSFSVTAVLFGGYWTWLRSTRSTAVAALADCTFELDHPDRVGVDETLDLFVYQDCKTARRHDIAIEPVRSSLRMPAPSAAPSTDCTPTTASCTTTFRPVTGDQAHTSYQIRLKVDGHPIALATIEKDRFAAARAIGEKTIPAVAFIPLILSLAVSFHKDVKKKLLGMFRGGAADEAGEAVKP